MGSSACGWSASDTCKILRGTQRDNLASLVAVKGASSGYWRSAIFVSENYTPLVLFMLDDDENEFRMRARYKTQNQK